MLFSTIIGSVFSLLGAVNGRKRSNNELAKRDSWGAAWSTGPCQTGNSLKYVSYNFSPGKPPNPGKDALFLWLGISNGTGDLIQAGVDDYASNSWCGASASQWCAEASIFGSFGQLNGASGVVNADETIKVVYQRNSDKSGWVQNVYDGSGNLFSTLSSSSGPMTGLGTGTECNENCAGSVDYQYYTNLEFIFEEADPNYSQTLGVGTGVSHTPLTSSDGGITWTVSQIIIPPMIAGATTRTTSTTKSTGTTTTRSTTTTTTGSGSCAAHYAQCGGIGYTGATTCCSGYTCTYSNAYYSQCL